MSDYTIAEVSEKYQNYIVDAKDIHDGVQVLFKFENGYGASVIFHSYSFGIELAVAKFKSEENIEWDICYDTPITDDVIGNLSHEELEKILVNISWL